MKNQSWICWPLFVLLVLVFAIVRVPGARAAAPTCRYTIATDTVTDNETKLTWQRTVDALKFSSDEAKSYCAGLTLDGGGWRLPTVKELQSTVDLSQWKPAIDATAFPETPAENFWSYTAYAPKPGTAWTVHALDGGIYPKDATFAYYVRCVR